VKRTIYLSIFVVLSVAAGWFYYDHTRQATALVASHDLSVGTTIQDSDVALRAVNPGSLAEQILHSPGQAIGQVVAYPILAGDFVDARQIAPMKNSQLLSAGLQLPPGYRIIGLPVTPAAAVGGVLKPGDMVDVMAIPSAPKAATLNDEPPPAPVMLGKDVLVIGLRTDQGTSVDSADRGLNAGTNRPAAVLLAIPQIDEAAYSAAIADSTFVLTLSTE
jgi:Flp pilus assembly protein CpaB